MTVEKGTRVYIDKMKCYGTVDLIIKDDDGNDIYIVFCINTPSECKKFKLEDLSEFE